MSKTDEDYWRARVEKLESRLRELSLSHARAGSGDIERRLGSILISSIKSPWRWPFIPLQMYRAVKFHRQLSAGAFTDAVEHKARLVFDRANSVGVHQAIEELNDSETSTAFADLLVRASEIAFVNGRSDLELRLAERAQRVEESWRVLDRLVSARIDLGDVGGAYEAYQRLELLDSQTPGNAGCEEALAQWRRTSLVELDALRELKVQDSDLIKSVEKRVCYVLHAALPMTSNGYATRSHAVACALRENGWDVVPLARPGYPWDVVGDASDFPSIVEVEGLNYHYVATSATEKNDVLAYLIESADKLTEKMRELKPALVIAGSNYRVALVSLIACRRLNIPMIYEQRGRWEVTRQSRDPEYVYSASFQVQHYMEGLLAREADSVWTLTAGMRDLLVEQGVNEKHIQLLPNGADAEKFQPVPRDVALAQKLGIPSGVPVFGYVGSFVDYEGLDDLIEAAILLKAKGGVFRLLLVGSESPSGEKQSSLTAALKQRAKVGDLGSWLIMTGRVPHEEVTSYYSLIDITPFARKGLPVCELVSPLKPLEAMAMGKLVVVSNVKALAEICNWGERGIVVEKNSPSAFSEGLFEALSELKAPSGIAERGTRFVREQRDWTGLVKQLQAGMLQLVKQHK